MVDLDVTIVGGQAAHMTDHEKLHAAYNASRGHAECYIDHTATAATTISVKATAYKAAGTTTLSTTPAAVHFTMPANNRLTYTGATTATAFISAVLSCTTAGANDLLGFHIAKSGTVVHSSHIDRFVGTGTDQGAVAVQLLCSLAPNEYVEVWVENESAAADITVEHMSLVAITL